MLPTKAADAASAPCLKAAASRVTAALAPQVKLSDDFAEHGDADEGPLSPGDTGTLVEDDGSGKPYRVRAASGKTWWYKKAAIVKAEVHSRSGQRTCHSHLSCWRWPGGLTYLAYSCFATEQG